LPREKNQRAKGNERGTDRGTGKKLGRRFGKDRHFLGEEEGPETGIGRRKKKRKNRRAREGQNRTHLFSQNKGTGFTSGKGRLPIKGKKKTDGRHKSLGLTALFISREGGAKPRGGTTSKET